MARHQAVVEQKTLAEISVGDKLLTDIVGYKGKTLLPRGTTISAKEKKWLEKKVKEGVPVLASRKYRTNTKAMGTIKDAAGKILVAPGELITEKNLAPLLTEGFQLVESFEAEHKMFFRKSEWPKDAPWHIEQFNPLVQVETLALVNDDGTRAAPLKAKEPVKEPVKEPAGAGAGNNAGGQGPKK